MKVALLCLGKTNKSYVMEGLREFEKRLSRYCKFERIELKDVKAHSDPATIKNLEFERISDKISDKDYLILLDEKGEEMDSRNFAKSLTHPRVQSAQRLVFVVAGAYGASDSLKSRADKSLSLSKMTYSHQLIRLVFEEQLYRAFSILNKHPYHND